MKDTVLNLIITGIPSILEVSWFGEVISSKSFKPYYNWNTFNTNKEADMIEIEPLVLNLIITGIPSIHRDIDSKNTKGYGFKPYYNWNTFNT